MRSADLRVAQPSAREQITAGLSLRHLDRLTGEFGIFEHARHSVIRVEHGLCTDDNARLAVLVAKAHGVRGLSDDIVTRLRITAARFVIDSIVDDGSARNRRHPRGHWLDEPHIGDNWGRAVHALGALASTESDDARVMIRLFDRSARHRSRNLRSMAHAALGAAAVLERVPDHGPALDMLADTADLIWSASASADWPWPEERLSYANGIIPEALIAAAGALGRPDEMADALALLRWLVDVETSEGRLSPTPAVGRGPDDLRPAFDQQPIEVAALVSAAARAARHHRDPMWRDVINLSVGWFLGANDSGHSMIDVRTGGGYDGLQADGVNLNQGAESTMAMVETLLIGYLTGVER